MNEVIYALILGVVQGITEFLPVSSSGHIEIAEAILGVSQENSIWMTIVLHFATAIATIVVYYKEILKILKAVFSFTWNEDFQYSIKIILSMLPAGLVGFFFEDWLEKLFDGKLLLVGSMLILTSVLLLLADKAKKTNKKVGFFHSIWIGLAQAVAILPGISRSGSTISTSVLLGVDRESSAKFSFLMVIPVIFGIILKKIVSDDFIIEDYSMNYTALLVGFVSAFFTGIIACKWMIQLVKKAQLKYFSFYCLIVGSLIILWTYL